MSICGALDCFHSKYFYYKNQAGPVYTEQYINNVLQWVEQKGGNYLMVNAEVCKIGVSDNFVDYKEG